MCVVYYSFGENKIINYKKRIETGRYVGEPVERRTCRFCDLVAIEDEKHFLLTCDLYNDIRTYVFGDILRQNVRQWRDVVISRY